MADRINYAGQLARQANSASNRTLAKGYSTVAKAVLTAEPRDEVARRRASLTAKADAMPPGDQRDRLHRQAQRLLEENPPAPTPEEQARNTRPVNAGGTTGLGRPRVTGPGASLPADGPQQARPGDMPGRQVVKAALPVAVWDQRRRLLGVVQPARIVQPAAGAAEAAVAKAMRSGWRVGQAGQARCGPSGLRIFLRSGRRGRRFKSGHPDQRTQVNAMITN